MLNKALSIRLFTRVGVSGGGTYIPARAPDESGLLVCSPEVALSEGLAPEDVEVVVEVVVEDEIILMGFHVWWNDVQTSS